MLPPASAAAKQCQAIQLVAKRCGKSSTSDQIIAVISLTKLRFVGAKPYRFPSRVPARRYLSERGLRTRNKLRAAGEPKFDFDPRYVSMVLMLNCKSRAICAVLRPLRMNAKILSSRSLSPYSSAPMATARQRNTSQCLAGNSFARVDLTPEDHVECADDLFPAFTFRYKAIATCANVSQTPTRDFARF